MSTTRLPSKLASFVFLEVFIDHPCCNKFAVVPRGDRG
jgi:hypothetical protein